MILAFHNIGKDFLSLTPERFEEIIVSLKKNGVSFVSPDYPDLKNVINDKNKILLTFDDGYRGLYKYGLKIFKKHNLKGIVFVVANAVGKKAFWDKVYGSVKTLMNWEEIEKLKEIGFEIGSHTLNHSILTNMRKEEIYRELSVSKSIIEQNIKTKVDKIAYPYYATDWRVKEISTLTGYNFGFGGIKGGSIVNLQRLPVYKELSIKNIVDFAKTGKITITTKIIDIISRANLLTKRLQCFT